MAPSAFVKCRFPSCAHHANARGYCTNHYVQIRQGTIKGELDPKRIAVGMAGGLRLSPEAYKWLMARTQGGKIMPRLVVAELLEGLAQADTGKPR